MKNRTLKITLAALVVSVVTGAQYFVTNTHVSAGAKFHADDLAVERTIQGVWTAQHTRRNCETGAPLSNPSNGLLNFAQGGTMSEIGTGPRSVAFGLWQREKGWDQYSYSFRFLRFNPDGTFAGSQVIRATAELGESGNDLTATATFQILDANGNVINTGCATSVSTRFDPF